MSKPKVAHTSSDHQDETNEFEDLAYDKSDDEGVDVAELDSSATAFL